ncbi:MAG: Y-family DNA polymerase [Chlamydiae bacterium]|nr:Y-family DNA polymerase [Chlamydiota bacterium]
MDDYYFLVDCNQFFVSCERLFNPKLLGKPVVVLSNNDGCIIARSREAKRLGIPMGAPAYKYLALFKEKKVIVYSSNFSLYGDMSCRVMQILQECAPEVEEYSIDEAFLLLPLNHCEEEAKKIQKKIEKFTGIPVSIGIGKTKTLAKVANDLAKRDEKLEGVFALIEEVKMDQILQKLPLKDIWGIGEKLSQRLHSFGIKNGLELKRANQSWLRETFSISEAKIALELGGVSCLHLEDIEEPKQSITCSRSFEKRLYLLEELEEALSGYVSKAAEKLRDQNSYTSFLTVFLLTSPFIQKPYFNSSGIALIEPTNYTPTLISQAKKVLNSIYRKGYPYKKVGVTLSGFIFHESYQGDLFGQSVSAKKKEKKAMDLFDAIRNTFGEESIQFGAEGVKKQVEEKSGLVSNRFTTRWDELLLVY